jgi:hypothetical protein
MSLDPEHLLEVAYSLIPPAESKDTESAASLRRSISTSYYALFHCLIDEACRDIVGQEPHAKARTAFLARKFNHGTMLKVLQLVGGAKSVNLKDPDWTAAFIMNDDVDVLSQVPGFAANLFWDFKHLKDMRQSADYDASFNVSRSEAINCWRRATQSIEDWRKIPLHGPTGYLKRGLNLLLLVGTSKRD